ncbi:MAG: translation initiation factor IF-2 [Alphaproteobacteria bacterium]
MSDSKGADEKRSSRLTRPGRLELKKTVETGQVRQSFSRGRSKAVTVEVRKKRTFAPGESGRMAEVKVAPRPQPETGQPGEGGAEMGLPAAPGERAAQLRRLTDQEMEARARALEEARRTGEDARWLPAARRAEEADREEADREAAEREAAARAAEEEARKRAEEEARRKAEEDARRKAEEEAGRKAEEMARRLSSTEETAKTTLEVPRSAAQLKGRLALLAEEEERRERARRGAKGEARRSVLGPRRDEPRRRAGKLTVTQALVEEERVRSLASVRRARERERRAAHEAGEETETAKVVREVVVREAITVQELANRMAVRGGEVVKGLMKMGSMATINQVIDGDTAELLVVEFGHKVKRVSEADVEIGVKGEPDEEKTLKPHPPVVTVMGHVDHGKTSLLDALRETDVVGSEAGGITQHIGAYQVTLDSGRRITFIDTPGHEAFTAIRARGANVTDVVVLVVAADDGVMPQTVEAINHAKAAEVPIVVAVNKIDTKNADPQQVRRDLLQHEVVVEELGGEALAVDVSAKEKTNLDKLEEAILLQADLLELKANPDRPAEGVVIEARLDRGRGPVATVLVQRGTLRVGDIVVAGNEWGRVRALRDDRGRVVEEAGPAMPVEVLGLDGIAAAGDELASVENERRAREVTSFRQKRTRAARAAAGARGSLEQMFADIAAGEAKELPVVIKADVHGSVEAIESSLKSLSTDEVVVRVLHAGVGEITEADVTLANASNAVVAGFNVRANAQARELAGRDGIEIRFYSVIYELIDDFKKVLAGLLEPIVRERVVGSASILEVFDIGKVGKVAGCRVTGGVVNRSARIRLLRDNVVIHEGRLKSLKRFKDDVRQVKEGSECGMSIDNDQDIQVGDVIEAYEIEEMARAV